MSLGLRYTGRWCKVSIKETVAERPGLSSSCTMQCCQGVLPAFGLGLTPPLQCQTRPALRLRPHPVDTLWPLARAPVTPLHRRRGGGQPLVIEKREGFIPGGGKEFLQGRPHLGEPLEPPPPFAQLSQSGLASTAPIK